MTAPLCHYCASTPMLEKCRIHQPQGDKHIAIFQCDSCKRIEAVTE